MAFNVLPILMIIFKVFLQTMLAASLPKICSMKIIFVKVKFLRRLLITDYSPRPMFKMN